MIVVCYGDSNTYGYDPRSYFGGRYDFDRRWTSILAENTGWEVSNEGQNGREIVLESGIDIINADLFLIMLGTNDLLQGCTARDAAMRMKELLQSISIEPTMICLIAPPSMRLGEWVSDVSLIEACHELAGEYAQLAREFGTRFLDASSWPIPMCYDGVHFTEEGQRLFAQLLQQALTE